MEKGNVTFPSDRTIGTSRISENPKGDRWIAIEPGKYAKPETFRFNVISSADETGKDDFKFKIQARIKSDEDNTDLNQKVVQVREYSYNIQFPEQDDRTEVDRGFEDLEDSEDDPRIIRDKHTSQNHSQSHQNAKNITINNTEISQATKTSNTSNSTEPSKDIDNVTVILSAGIFGSIAYLWMIL